MITTFPKQRRRLPALAAAYGASFVAGRRQRAGLSQVETYCMFVGYPRSGHSLVGSLLDAHPNAVIAHELDALGFVRAGFRRSQLYALILENSRAIAAGGRAHTGYDYVVPGSWQGRFERLQVIGDKRGSKSMSRLQQRPELLDRLRRVVRDDVRFVHVVRNPYDNITTMAKRQRTSLEAATADYFSLAESVAALKRRVGAGAVVDIRHESLIDDPRATLRGLCVALRLEPFDGYVERCAAVVFTTPHRTRFDAGWTAEQRATVERSMRRFEFLDGYCWDA